MRYVHTDAVWSPDGKYLVFARAEAKAAYPDGGKQAITANDPNETQIQYDLYRIPFNGGRGGRAEPIAGASQNGMSNTFPKISPDGRWIVFVQCRNGQLMRPDSELYIVPAEGGRARRLHCNAPPMNSWHSFSPNGRWLVFSSKRRSPYTQMFLTHLDDEGNDSPAILVDHATAANRAVNIPEFVNIAADGLEKIDVPAAEQFFLLDRGKEQLAKGQFEAARAAFQRAIEIDPEYAMAHANLGISLGKLGNAAQSVEHLERALQLNPQISDGAEIRNNFAVSLSQVGRMSEAIAEFQRCLKLDSHNAQAHFNFGVVLSACGQLDQAIDHYQRALELRPDLVDAHNNLGLALAGRGQRDEAIAHFRKALEIRPDYLEAHNNLGNVLADAGRLDEAIAHFRKALELKPDCIDACYNLARPCRTKGTWTRPSRSTRKC